MSWFEVAYFFVVAAQDERAKFASLRFAMVECFQFSRADPGQVSVRLDSGHLARRPNCEQVFELDLGQFRDLFEGKRARFVVGNTVSQNRVVNQSFAVAHRKAKNRMPNNLECYNCHFRFEIRSEKIGISDRKLIPAESEWNEFSIGNSDSKSDKIVKNFFVGKNRHFPIGNRKMKIQRDIGGFCIHELTRINM